MFLIIKRYLSRKNVRVKAVIFVAAFILALAVYYFLVSLINSKTASIEEDKKSSAQLPQLGSSFTIDGKSYAYDEAGKAVDNLIPAITDIAFVKNEISGAATTSLDGNPRLILRDITMTQNSSLGELDTVPFTIKAGAAAEDIEKVLLNLSKLPLIVDVYNIELSVSGPSPGLLTIDGRFYLRPLR